MNKLPLLLLMLTAAAMLATAANAQEAIYPTTIGSLNSRVTILGHGTISGLNSGEEARLETITFQSSEFQTVDILKEELHINGETIYPQYIMDEFGNKYMLFHITQNGNFDYEVSADVNSKAMVYSISDYALTKPPESVKAYTQPSEKVESNSTEMLTLENNKIFGNQFVSSLNQTINWVNDYVEYASGDDFRKYYLEQYSAIETLLNKKGVCDEFSELATGMLRAKDIPTRLAIGLTYDGLEWGNHAWIETYDQKLDKWIPSDPTFREAGFVDAMHIKLGSFDDITNSNAKCFYPSTAKCTIEGQGDLPDVNILGKEYMANVQMDSNASTLKANAWNEVPITITNTTSSVLSVPIRLQDIKGVLVQGKKKSVILAPGQRQTVVFDVLPMINLGTNEIAKGKLVFNSLSSPYEREITVTPNSQPAEGEVSIDDVTPIAHEGTLKIQISATNYYPADKQIDITIKDGNYNSTGSETVPSYSTKAITKEVQNYDTAPYDINISTPTKIFYTEIIPVRSKLAIVNPPKQTIIEQRLPLQTPQSAQQTEMGSPIAILMGLLAGIAVMLLGLFLVNKRYV